MNFGLFLIKLSGSHVHDNWVKWLVIKNPIKHNVQNNVAKQKQLNLKISIETEKKIQKMLRK